MKKISFYLGIIALIGILDWAYIVFLFNAPYTLM